MAQQAECQNNVQQNEDFFKQEFAVKRFMNEGKTLENLTVVK